MLADTVSDVPRARAATSVRDSYPLESRLLFLSSGELVSDVGETNTSRQTGQINRPSRKIGTWRKKWI